MSHIPTARENFKSNWANSFQIKHQIIENRVRLFLSSSGPCERATGPFQSLCRTKQRVKPNEGIDFVRSVKNKEMPRCMFTLSSKVRSSTLLINHQLGVGVRYSHAFFRTAFARKWMQQTNPEFQLCLFISLFVPIAVKLPIYHLNRFSYILYMLYRK